MPTEEYILARNLKVWLLHEMSNAEDPGHIQALTAEIARVDEVLKQEMGKEDK